MRLILVFLFSFLLSFSIKSQGESSYFSLLTEDFDRDGVCDIIKTGYDGKALYFRGKGDGTLYPSKELFGAWWAAFSFDAPIVTWPYIYTITPSTKVAGRYDVNIILFNGIIQALVAQHQIDPEGDLANGYITSIKMAKLDNSRDGDSIEDIILVWNTEVILPEYWPPKWNRHAAYLSPTELEPVQNFFTDVKGTTWVSMVGLNAVEASRTEEKRNNDFILITTGISTTVGNGIGLTCFEEGDIGPRINYHKWTKVPLPLKTHLGTLPYDVMVKGQFRLNLGQPKPTVSVESTIMSFIGPTNKDEIFYFFPWFVPHYMYRPDDERGFPLHSGYWYFTQGSVADYDGDGWDEFVAMVGVTTPQWADAVIISAPRVSTVQQTILVPPYMHVANTAAGDFNRDGKKDLVIGVVDYNINGVHLLIYTNTNPNPFPFVQSYQVRV